MEKSNSSLSQYQRSSLVFHSFIIIGIGLLGGMAWVIALAGKLELWPIPPLELSLPETKELWRNAHIGPIMNGIFALAIVATSPFLTLSSKLTKHLYYGTIVMLWFNTFGYQSSPFTSGRGLGANGEALNIICYFSFYIAALCALYIVGLGIFGSRKTMINNKQ